MLDKKKKKKGQKKGTWYKWYKSCNYDCDLLQGSYSHIRLKGWNNTIISLLSTTTGLNERRGFFFLPLLE